jgi:hypothetical protein
MNRRRLMHGFMAVPALCFVAMRPLIPERINTVAKSTRAVMPEERA